MGLIDSIIGVESGGNPNATNPNSSALSHVGDELRADARVGELFLARRPTAILGRIVTIGVLAINRMGLRRLFAHVRQKCLEAIPPALADLNPARPIERVRNVALVFASINHATPRVILGRGFPASTYRDRPPVGRVRHLGRINLVAAAAKRIAGFKVWHRDNGLASTITAAEHTSDLSVAIFANCGVSLRDSLKLTEASSNVVYAGAH